MPNQTNAQAAIAAARYEQRRLGAMADRNGGRWVACVYHASRSIDSLIAALEAATAEQNERARVLIDNANHEAIDAKKALGAMIAERDKLAAEVERLRAIVDPLPLTEDGQRITDGTVTYCASHNPYPHHWKIRLMNSDTPEEHGEKQYSTLEAAKAAGGGSRG